ncbi:ABC transporter ATP-binding protein [Lactiplantibacillus plajomi]|uniref:ABC transporter ATP-binding protein n=1 Tax=Lactiplantibacillus plajomi TaxID=1457217 RepID=A0ABV6K5D8_9LACO|nr:ABC transporter ATP-binding protein [Lactiplantibacillus plajomi]
MTTIIEIKNLQVTFPDDGGPVHAVRGVDLTLNQGETLALVGESGSGKSVTTHALLNILPKDAQVSADKLQFNGQDLLGLSQRDINQIRGSKISLIFQDPLSALNPTMRIGKQIGEALRFHAHVRGTALKQAVHAEIEAVGLPDPQLIARKYPHELSGGQRQRVMIAIALIAHPQVLIADEPTTALDVTLQAKIIALIKAQKQQRDLSIIFITHDLGVVANIADRVAIMYAGQIVEVGTAEEIFYNPQHPYTWGLLDSVPDPDSQRETLFTLPGNPPDPHEELVGDAFAPRNPYALAIDFQEEPPLTQVSTTHFVRSWLLDPQAPAYEPPASIRERWAIYQQDQREVPTHG